MSVVRSPLTGFSGSNPDFGNSELAWFEVYFKSPELDLEKCIVFDYQNIKELLDTDPKDLCFAKQFIEKSSTEFKSTLVVASINADGVFIPDKLFVGNLFPTIDIPQLQDTFLTDWEIDQFKDKIKYKRQVYIDWSKYQPVTTPLHSNPFLTVSFSKSQFSILDATTKRVAFFPGYVDVQMHYTSNSGIKEKWTASTQILIAFGIAENNTLVGPIYPSTSWPHKYPPYTGA